MPELSGHYGPWLTSTDKVKCGFCKKVHPFSELLKVNGRAIPKSDGGGVWQSVFYHCPCDLEHPLAYDEGEGQVQLISTSAELQAREF